MFAYSALSEELTIPLSSEIDIKLGQGFDLEKMQWRELCVSGQELETVPSESSVESSYELGHVYQLSRIDGSLSAGLTLLGGLAEVSQKNSFYSQWVDTENSKGLMFHLDFGTSRKELRKIHSLFPYLSTDKFLKRCGTHLVVRLEYKHDVMFMIKYLAESRDWLEKIRWEMTSKGFWGLVKKSWTEESLKQASDARASVKVGLKTQGYFRDLINVYLSSPDSALLNCQFPYLNTCQNALNLYEQVLHKIYQTVKDQELTDFSANYPTHAVLLPYRYVNNIFNKMPVLSNAGQKIHFLNSLRSESLMLQGQANDLKENGTNEIELKDLEEKINLLDQRIKLCTEQNTCN